MLYGYPVTGKESPVIGHGSPGIGVSGVENEFGKSRRAHPDIRGYLWFPAREWDLTQESKRPTEDGTVEKEVRKNDENCVSFPRCFRHSSACWCNLELRVGGSGLES